MSGKKALANSIASLVEDWCKEKDDEPKVEKVEKEVKKLFPSCGKFSGKFKFGKKKNSIASGTAGKQKAPVEIIKDIYLLPSPDIDFVPRKTLRRKYFVKGLVASAVPFHSDMSEEDIYSTIKAKFPEIFNPYFPPKFQILRAVGDLLVQPNVEEITFKTLKHLTSQGPVYVRTEDHVRNMDSDGNDSGDSLVMKRKKPGKSPSLESGSDDEEKVKLPPVLREDVPGCSKDTDGRGELSTRKLPCPVCYQKFNVAHLDDHASQCAQERFDNNLLIYPDKDEEQDHTLPYGIEEHESKEDDVDIDDILKELMSKLRGNGTSFLTVRRSSIFDDFMVHFAKPWNKTIKELKITFIGESAIDVGGPLREFFYDCIKIIQNRMFEDGCPIESVMLLSQKEYYYAGLLIGFSIVHQGPLPDFFQDWIYAYISTKDMAPHEIMPDSSFYEIPTIKKVMDAKTQEEYVLALQDEEFMDHLLNIGYRGLPKREALENREQLLRLINFKINIESKIPAINQLCSGLENMELLDQIRKNPKLFKDLFVNNGQQITMDRFLDELEPQFAPLGSNRRLPEENVFKHFSDYIDKLFNDGDSIDSPDKLLKFITGTGQMPRGGFEKKICVQFLHTCQSGCKCLPTTSSCFLSISIPIHMDTYEKIVDSMSTAIVSSPFFGKV